MDDLGQLPKWLGEMNDQFAVLLFSGLGGAFFRAVMAPEQHWKRRVMQGIGGGIAAVFLGGALGHVIDLAINAGTSSYLAAGFLMGSGGELAVKAFQDRLVSKK